MDQTQRKRNELTAVQSDLTLARDEVRILSERARRQLLTRDERGRLEYHATRAAMLQRARARISREVQTLTRAETQRNAETETETQPANR